MNDLFTILQNIEQFARILRHTEQTRQFLNKPSNITKEAMAEAEEIRIHLGRLVMLMREGRDSLSDRKKT